MTRFLYRHPAIGRLLALALLGGALFAVGTIVAAAQGHAVCAARDDLIAHLKGMYAERPVGAGLASPTEWFEIWANEETGTWSIVLSLPDGTACLLESGEGWVPEPPQITGENM